MKNLEEETKMDGSENRVSSSNPPKSAPNPRPSSTGENNENDLNQDQVISKLHNHRATATKHFMSPTVSAASKAATPRKKILAEKNDNASSSDVNFHKISDSDHKKSPRVSGISLSTRSSSRIVSLYNCASESDDNGDINLLANSSGKKYDPLTNYLSPRPKYLRFNPKRRFAILNRLEKEARGDLNSSFDSQKVNDEMESSEENVKDSCFSPMKESSVKQEDDGNADKKDDNIDEDSEEEEEEEEVEEGRGWCFNGVLKLLLTLIACMLSASYFCSTNSPIPFSSQKVIWGLNESYFMIQKQEVEAISTKIHNIGILAVEGLDMSSVMSDVEIRKDEIEESEGIGEAETFEDDVDGRTGDDEANANEDNQEEIDKAGETDGVGSDGIEFEAERFEELIDTYGRENSIGYGFEKEVEFSIQDSIEVNVDEIEEDVSEISGDKVGAVSGSFDHSMMAEINGQNAPTYEMENEVEDPLHPSVTFDAIREEEMLQSSEVFDGTESHENFTGSHEEFSGSSLNEVELGNENESEIEISSRKNTAVIGVSLFVLLVSLVFVYDSKKAKRTSSNRTKSSVKPLKKFEMEDKVSIVEKKIEFLAKPSLPPPIEEAHKELSRNIHAPTVELIGEIVVGGVTRSQRSSVGKFQIRETEESSAAAFSLKQDPVFLPRPVSSPARSPEVVFPIAHSSSYGNAIADIRTSKKEGEKRGEAAFEATSVRRSNRLRNRASTVS